MTDVPAGWFPDPYGRFAQRYWDGSRWTEHVATGGVQAVDPMGAMATPATQWEPPGTSAGAPAGGPASDAAAGDVADPDTAATTPAGPNAAVRLLDAMGAGARERPRPSLTTTLAGIGGALVVLGVLVIAGGDSENQTTIAVVAAVLLLAAWALGRFVVRAEVRAAATGAAALSIAVFALAATVDDEGLGSTVTGLILTVLYLAAWVLPGFRGRTLFLGLGAIALIGTIGSLTAPDPEQFFDDGSALPEPVTSLVGDQGVVLLIGAAVYLGLTWWLDRKGYAGAATGLVAAGLVAALGGTGLLAQTFGDAGAAFLVLVVGILVCLVGSHGGRRATTWAGAALAAGGLVALLGVTIEPESTAATGAMVLVAGAALVAVPMLVGLARNGRERDHTG